MKDTDEGGLSLTQVPRGGVRFGSVDTAHEADVESEPAVAGRATGSGEQRAEEGGGEQPAAAGEEASEGEASMSSGFSCAAGDSVISPSSMQV